MTEEEQREENKQLQEAQGGVAHVVAFFDMLTGGLLTEFLPDSKRKDKEK